LGARRREAIVATKFGNVREPDDPTKRAIDGRPEYVRQACDASLSRLGMDHIAVVEQIDALASAKGCTPAQVA